MQGRFRSEKGPIPKQRYFSAVQQNLCRHQERAANFCQFIAGKQCGRFLHCMYTDSPHRLSRICSKDLFMKLFNRGTEFYLTMVSLLLLLFVAACGQQRDVLPATEEEQIKNVALDYFVRDSAVPPYEATIEAVVDDWARVALSPVESDTSGEPLIIYLQNQADADNPVPTAEPMAVPGNIAPTGTELGWAIITPPQAQFTSAELNAYAVPAKIRP
ncbi:MAG: hypothetical protein R2867_10750 [Caldilineaceae bacterium]